MSKTFSGKSDSGGDLDYSALSQESSQTFFLFTFSLLIFTSNLNMFYKNKLL